jgi:hypothetical protein
VLFPHGPDRRYVTCLVMKSFLFVLPLFWPFIHGNLIV